MTYSTIVVHVFTFYKQNLHFSPIHKWDWDSQITDMGEKIHKNIAAVWMQASCSDQL